MTAATTNLLKPVAIDGTGLGATGWLTVTDPGTPAVCLSIEKRGKYAGITLGPSEVDDLIDALTRYRAAIGERHDHAGKVYTDQLPEDQQ